MAIKPKVSKLFVFSYDGKNKKNQKVKGEVTAASAALAKVNLRKQGIVVSRINKKTIMPWQQLFKQKVKPLDIAIFTRQLATMMKAGVPLVQSFEIVAEGLDNPAIKEMVLKIKAEVEGGDTLASALRKQPEYFDNLFCALVESGEQSGALEVMLERIASYKEKSELLKQKIKKAIKYPATVLVIAMIVTAILLVKVVPVFADLFSSFGAELPKFTQLVVGWSDWFTKEKGVIKIGIFFAVCFFGLREAHKRSEPFRDFIDKMVLKLPIFGDLAYKSVLARFSRTLATTFAAGVPMIDALDSTAGAAGNVVYRRAILQIKHEVSTGQQLNFAMKASNIFPPMAVQMVAIGEESGRVDEMLEKVATHYENEVDNAVDGLTSMMEPLIMAILGVLVGGLVIAMYLPIFQMGAVVG